LQLGIQPINEHVTDDDRGDQRSSSETDDE
jgi:hypothetical protein